MGEATVVFSSKEEALRAKRRYTDMALDGQVMKLELVEGGPVGGRGPKTLSSGIRFATDPFASPTGHLAMQTLS